MIPLDFPLQELLTYYWIRLKIHLRLANVVDSFIQQLQNRLNILQNFKIHYSQRHITKKFDSFRLELLLSILQATEQQCKKFAQQKW